MVSPAQGETTKVLILASSSATYLSTKSWCCTGASDLPSIQGEVKENFSRFEEQVSIPIWDGGQHHANIIFRHDDVAKAS